MVKAFEPDMPTPRSNPHLFGHDAAEQKFLGDFTSGKLHHAYLITGAKGIGKATFAYRMARFVLSHGAAKSAPIMEEGPSLFGDLPPQPLPAPPPVFAMNMDPSDPLFRRIASGSHTDLLVLTPAYDAKKQSEKAQISVDDARKVPQFFSLTAAESSWRVVVVDAVDQLNHQAANALLKIMEEPPPNALLLLVCHAPGGVLATIRSRCRHFALQEPGQAAFEQTLHTIAPHIDLSDYAALFALSYGSPGLAITLNKHQALGMYGKWLAALSPTSSDSARQQFASDAANVKSPEAWSMLLHTWNTLMHRVSLYPHHDAAHPIVTREDAQLAAIAQAMPYALRQQWLASARQLIAVTDSFHLDKKSTIRLMLDPQRLTHQFPAAA